MNQASTDDSGNSQFKKMDDFCIELGPDFQGIYDGMSEEAFFKAMR